MISRPRIAALLGCLPLLLLGQAPRVSDERPGAKSWVGRHQEIEDYLRTAECVSLETFVPNQLARCSLRPGGPVARMAWKTLPPGTYRGFKESYKAEIAAYEVDKLMKLDMVPPSVERRLDGRSGAAQLWVEDVVTFKGDETPDQSTRVSWERQLVRMTMFDNLIGNRDRNAGNTLRDSMWNLILIDHSRAFPTNPELPRKMPRVDGPLWEAIQSLTRARLGDVLRAWLTDEEIDAIIQRRERMKAELSTVSR